MKISIANFKKSGDKRKVKSEIGFGKKPIVYENLGDGIGVLSINSFWGKRWSSMLLFGKDWRYKRLLRRAMRRIDRDNIKDLIIECQSERRRNDRKRILYAKLFYG